MLTLPQELQAVLLSTRPADPELARATRIAGSVALLFALALAPFAREPLPRTDLFLPIYQTAVVVCDIVAAALLFNCARIGNATRHFLLAGGYAFSAAMAVLHALSFPGLLAPGGLLGAGEQTTAWLYFLWHIGFALAVLGYALTPQGEVRLLEQPSRIAPRVAQVVLICLAAAAVLMAMTTLGHDALPHLMSRDDDLPLKYVVAAVTLATTLAAALALLRRRPPTVLDLWVVVVIAAWACEVALASLFNAGRFSVGWYAGRVYGLISAATLVVVFIAQEARLRRHLVESLAGEVLRRGQLEEVAGRLSQAEAEARRALSELRLLAHQRLGVREAERQRLARDLHDELGQSLLALKLELASLAGHASDRETADRVQSMFEIVDGAIQSTRRVVAELRPPLLDELGFNSGLASFVDDYAARAAMACRLRLEPSDLDLPEPYASAVFRIVQEALTNAARHARAGEVDIEVRRSGGEVRVRARDDGQGFDSAAPVRPDANGLQGMRERVLLLAGQLQVDSAPGRGTVIDISLPLDPPQGPLPSGAPPSE